MHALKDEVLLQECEKALEQLPFKEDANESGLAGDSLDMY